ncbi:MAG: CAP domain-containing protein [Spirochaetota bacterium]
MRTRRALIIVFTILLGSCASLSDLPVAFEPPTERSDTQATGSQEAVDEPSSGPAPERPAPERPAPIGRVSIDTLYARSPDPGHEDPGELLGTERRAVLAEVNRIRALHGLAAVTYDERYDEEVTAAALIIAANAAMTHYPDDSMVGYSAAGAAGAQTSNIHISFSTNATAEPSIAHVRNWLIDDGVPSLGHRRYEYDVLIVE